MSRKDAVSVLVVDDNLFILNAITFILEGEGYNVVTCKDVKDGMDKFRKAGFDVIISDIKMPGAGGIELLENIRNIDSGIPVILMTAYVEAGKALDPIKKGAFDFILKPFDPKYLLHSVKKAISHRRINQRTVYPCLEPNL